LFVFATSQGLPAATVTARSPVLVVERDTDHSTTSYHLLLHFLATAVTWILALSGGGRPFASSAACVASPRAHPLQLLPSLPVDHTPCS